MHAVPHGVGNSFGSLEALRVYWKQFSCFVLTVCVDRNWILKMVRTVNAVFGESILWVFVVVFW